MRTVLMLSLGLVACQRTERTSDIAPYFIAQTKIDRTVVSRNLEPNVMLLVDNSSALGDVNDSSSRAAQLKTAAHALLASGSTFRFGLSTFPSPSMVVELPPLDDEDLPAPLAANATAIDDAIQALTPGGNTETLAALQFAGALPSLNANDNRADFIVLFTGALPTGDPQATIDFIETLYQDHAIATAVVAIDPDPSAEAVFNDMARAGKIPRRCFVSDCGTGQTCDADGVCSQAFWSAANAATEFIASQLDVINELQSDPCKIELLDAPSRPEYLSVVINGVTLEAGVDTFQLDGNLLTLTGTTCNTVHRATAMHPAHIQVRAVEKF